jgi:hypothetical protein
MDPQSNWNEQLRIANRIADDVALPGDAERLAELVLDLSEWIRNGGFLPNMGDPKAFPPVRERA